VAAKAAAAGSATDVTTAAIARGATSLWTPGFINDVDNISSRHDDEGEMQGDNVVDPYDPSATGEDGTGDDEPFHRAANHRRRILETFITLYSAQSLKELIDTVCPKLVGLQPGAFLADRRIVPARKRNSIRSVLAEGDDQ